MTSAAGPVVQPGCAVSTTNAQTCCSSVTANTRATAASAAYEMNIFWPSRIQPSPSRRPRVVSCRGSDPVCGSVKAHAAGTSPATRRGTQRATTGSGACASSACATWTVVPGYRAATAQE